MFDLSTTNPFAWNPGPAGFHTTQATALPVWGASSPIRSVSQYSTQPFPLCRLPCRSTALPADSAMSARAAASQWQDEKGEPTTYSQSLMEHVRSLMPDINTLLDRARDHVATFAPGAFLIPGAAALPLQEPGIIGAGDAPAVTAVSTPSAVSGSPVNAAFVTGDSHVQNKTFTLAERLFEWGTQVADEFFGVLEPEERKAYLRLARRENPGDPLVAQQRLYEGELCTALGIARLDSLWIHTQRAPASHRGDAAIVAKGGQGGGDLVSWPLSTYVRMHGVDATVLRGGGAAEEFIAKTFINADPSGRNRQGTLDVRRFLTVVRAQDPGGKLVRWAEEQCGEAARTNHSGMWPGLLAQTTDALEFDLLDAYRRGQTGAVEYAALRKLMGIRTGASQHALTWQPLEFRFNGIEGVASALGSSEGSVTPLSAFVLRLRDEQGKESVYSYIPGRPDGAIQKHAVDGEGFLDAFLSDIVRDIESQSGRGNWFLHALPWPVQKQVLQALEEETVDRDSLNPLARKLHEWWGESGKLRRVQLMAKEAAIDQVPLLDGMTSLRAQRIREAASHALTANDAADWARIKSAFWRVVGESLEVLMLPVPGKVSIPGRAWLFQLGLFKQAVSVPVNIALGNMAEVAQDMGDLVDAVVGGRFQSYAAKLVASPGRAGKLKVERAHGGQLVIWRPEDMHLYTTKDGAIPGTEGVDGVWRHGDQLHVRMKTPAGETRVARVAQDGGVVRLFHTSLGGVAPVLVRSADGLWQLQVNERAAMSNVELLRTMLGKDLRDLSDARIKLALDAGGATRQELDDIWEGRSKPSAGFGEALRAAGHRQLVASLGDRLRGDGYLDLDSRAERLVMARLAEQAQCVLKVYWQSGQLLMSFAPRGDGVAPGGRIEVALVQEGPWRSRVRHAPAEQGVEPENALFVSIIKGVEAQRGALPEDWPSGATVQERGAQLRTSCADWFAQADHHSHLLSALQNEGRIRAGVAVGAGDLLPLSLGAGSGDVPAWRLFVRRTYPSLSEAEMDEAAMRFPALRMLTMPPKLPAEARTWLDAVQREQRRALALTAIGASGGGALTVDAEAWFISSLRQLAGFPLDASVALFDHSGRLMGGWGPATSKDVIRLMRQMSPAGFCTYSALTADGDVIPPMKGKHELASSLLQAMTDSQRRSIGVDIADVQGFQSRVLDKAIEHGDLAGSSLWGVRSRARSVGLEPWRSRSVDMARELPGLDGIHRSASGKAYIAMGGNTYRVLIDSKASAGDASIWRVVDEACPAARKGNRYVPGESGESVAVRRVFGEWNLVVDVAEHSPVAPISFKAFAVGDVATLKWLWTQSLIAPDARRYLRGAEAYIRMELADGDDAFFRVSLTAADGFYEVLRPAGSASSSNSGKFVVWDGAAWDVVASDGLVGGGNLSQWFSPNYRKARRALDAMASGPKKAADLTVAQREAFGEELTILLAGSNADTKESVKQFVEAGSSEVNRPLRENRETPELTAFMAEFKELNAYVGPAYRATQLSVNAATSVRTGVGKVFQFSGVQSASTQAINAFGWLSEWSGGVAKADATEKAIFVLDRDIPKVNIATNMLPDHVGVAPRVLMKVLAVREVDKILFVYVTAPTKMPDHTYSLADGAQII